MSRLNDDFVDVVDGHLSVDDNTFYLDIKLLAWVPLVPALILGIILGTPNDTVTLVAVISLVCCIPWVVFLFRRQKKKKQEWIKPTRWSDDLGSY